MRFWSAFMLLLLVLPAMAADLQSLDDSELSGVSGGDGIAIGLEYGVNTDASGAPLASLGNCAGTGTVTATGGDRCRFAWQVGMRKDASGNAAWTVAKNGWLSVSIPVLNLDVQPNMAGVGANPSYFDATRFTGYDASGNSICLLGTGACAGTTAIDALPALKLFYPAGSYNATQYCPTTGAPGCSSATARTSAGFTSVGLGLTIGRMTIEYDTCSAPATNCTSASAGYVPGYMRDVNNTGSFLGIQIKDNNGNFAMMAIGGSALIYGF